jgi:hypothetical protein
MTTHHDRATDSDLFKRISDLQTRLDRTESRLEHMISHDRMHPVPGCEFCEARRAA